MKSDEDTLTDCNFWGPCRVIAYYQTGQYKAQKKYSSNAAKSSNSEQ